MFKRVLSGLVGALAAFAAVAAVGYAVSGLEDFKSPGVPLGAALLGELLMFAMGFGGLALAIRLLAFSTSGQASELGLLKTVLLGIGMFFPGLIFSLPLTILFLAGGIRRLEGARADLALEASCYIGILTAIVSTVLLLKKRRSTLHINK